MSIEKLKQVAADIISRIVSVKGRGEEATKQALILPMLNALGYDIWDPSEVCPEYEADFAIKKTGQKEKVDLAISIKNEPKIYFEVKSIDINLDGHEGQLARYFNSTKSVTLGILTNGVEWRFFTDTGDPNVMDSQPFHIAKIEAADQGLDIVARFAKGVFSPEAIRDYATELKYTASIAKFLKEELDLKDKDPSENLIRWILKSEKMYEGIVNSNVVERFRPIAKAAITRVVRDIVRRSIVAMEEEAANQFPNQPNSDEIDNGATLPYNNDEIETTRQIITTERELKAFEIIKGFFDTSDYCRSNIYDASIRKEVPTDIAYKDTTAYFGIYLNKPTWWVARIALETKRPWISFSLDKLTVSQLLPNNLQIADNTTSSDTRIYINGTDDIQKLAIVFQHAFKKTIEERKPTNN
jgi:predicted type IV restriction endonuclease